MVATSTPLGQHPDLVHRCRHCRRPLTARVSVAFGCGPVCRRNHGTSAVTR